MVHHLLPILIGIGQVLHWPNQNGLYQSFIYLSVYQIQLIYKPYCWLHIILFLFGMCFYRLYCNQFANDVYAISHALKQKKSCVLEVHSLPNSLKHSTKTKMKIIRCGQYEPKTNLFMTIISQKIDANISDYFYLTPTQKPLISPELVMKINPEKLLSHRVLLSYKISPKRDQNQMIPIPKLGSEFSQLRSYIINHYRSWQNDHAISALSIALLFGEQSQITPKQWQLFKNTGTAHLVAISGLHMSLIRRMLTQSSLLVAHRIIQTNPLIYAEALASCALIFYAHLAGYSPSCIRAVSMAVISCLAKAYYFRAQTLNIALYCCLAHALLIPSQIANIGFQLSYGMVISLLFLDKVIEEKWQLWKKWLIVPIVSTFWSVIYWNQIVTSAPLANAIAVPWVTHILLPLTLLGWLISLINIKISKYVQLLINVNWQALLAILKILSNHLPSLNLGFNNLTIS